MHFEGLQGGKYLEIDLATNSLVLEKNKVGFLSNEPNEQEFLTFEGIRPYDNPPKTVQFFNETTGSTETLVYTPIHMMFQLSTVQN